MPEITLEQFAVEIGVSIEKIQQQFVDAGLPSREADDTITDIEKSAFFTFLRKQRGKDDNAEPHKITLRRKTMTELKVRVATPGSRSKSRSKTVSVEFRKRRTYAKRADVVETLKQEEEVAALERQKIEAEAKSVVAESAPVEADNAIETTPDINAQQTQVATQIATSSDTAAVPDVPPMQDLPIEPILPTPPIPPSPAPKEKKQGNKKYTRHGRQELHVATKGSGRRRKKSHIIPVIQRTTDNQHGFEKPTEPIVKEVLVPESITVFELAQRMSVKGSEVIKSMMNLGSMATINQTIDQDTAAIVVEEMGHKPKLQKDNALEEGIIEAGQQHGEQFARAPVVTIMGHVDHGKTSLLDYIRRTKVALGEAGGITQHIGAYRVNTKGGDIAFLDTPGHEAFTAMRARGAKITDLVIIVVAADDGVMPQTEEAVKHARAASVPMIIAVNKIDKENADLDQIKQQLATLDVLPEDWGGDIPFMPVSALTGQGVDELLESILLQTEILELKAFVAGPASGTVIESRLDKGRGPIATILVQGGTLNKGDVVLSGHEFGRVRVMLSANGDEMTQTGPSTPVEVLGLSGTPNAGDEMIVVPNEKKAREIALFRQGKYRALKIARQHASKLENVMNQMQADTVVTLNLLVKTDVQGSVEALSNALLGLSNDEVKVNIIANGVGGITESDINLALTLNAVVIGFNVRADASARKLIDSEGVDLRYYSIIYDVIDDVKAAIKGLLPPEIREQITGVAEVREIFRSPKFGDIAGCIVATGRVNRNNPIRVLRDNVVIYEGELESLRRFKDDVNEVKSGTDCGIGVKNYNDVQVGDQIEVFERISVERQI